MKKAVIFDMDGTLVDNLTHHLESWMQFFENHDIEVDRQYFLEHNHGTLVETVLQYFGTMDYESAVKLGHEKEALYREMYAPHMKPLPGLNETLDKLKSLGIKMSIATMADSPNIDFIMEGLEIREYFDFEIGGHQVKHGKPNPEVFQMSMTRHSESAEECLVIEDSGGGVEGAIRAGIQVVGMTTTFNKETLIDKGCIDAIPDYQHFNWDLLK